MCDINAFINEDGQETLILENVDVVELVGNDLKLVNIFGEERTVSAHITFYNNSEKKMVLSPVT